MVKQDISWREKVDRHIAAIDADLADDCAYEDRRAALRSGYPFGERKGYPYKAWLDGQRRYLVRHDDRPLNAKIAPLFFSSTDRPIDQAG